MCQRSSGIFVKGTFDELTTGALNVTLQQDPPEKQLQSPDDYSPDSPTAVWNSLHVRFNHKLSPMNYLLPLQSEL